MNIQIQIQVAHESDKAWGPSQFGPCVVASSSLEAEAELAQFVAPSDLPKVRKVWAQAAATDDQSEIDLGCGLTLMARPHR